MASGLIYRYIGEKLRDRSTYIVAHAPASNGDINVYLSRLPQNF